MATIDTLVTDCQTFTGSSATTLTAAQATEFVNAAIRRMIRKKNWTFLQKSWDASVPGPAVNWLVLPADFVQEVSVWTKDTAQGDPSKALLPIQRTQRQLWFGSQSPAGLRDPQFPAVAVPSSTTVTNATRGYYLWEGKLHIVPSPSAAITVTVDYVMATRDLVQSLTPADSNPFTLKYPDAVRNGALREAYHFLHEWEVAGQYEALFHATLKEAVDHDNAVAFSGMPASRGK